MSRRKLPELLAEPPGELSHPQLPPRATGTLPGGKLGLQHKLDSAAQPSSSPYFPMLRSLHVLTYIPTYVHMQEAT